jgi:hypothetical protein
VVVREVDLESLLEHRRGDHEDDQQHQCDVDERRDVDLGERALCPALPLCAHG